MTAKMCTGYLKSSRGNYGTLTRQTYQQDFVVQTNMSTPNHLKTVWKTASE